MGTLHVALCGMGTRAETESTMPLAKSQPIAAETVTTSTTAARVGTLAATDLKQVWMVTAVDEAMHVRMSDDADANAAGPDAGHLIPAGSTVPLGVTAVGEQVSARDVA